jgi:hypothetical protein
MSPEKEQELYDKYPELFQNRLLRPSQSPMHFGCEHSDGWYGILSNLCFMIKQHERNIEGQTKYKQKIDPEYKLDYTPVKFEQIKEKYGGLRVYHYGGDEYVHGLVSMAEAMSYQICEECGNKGEPNKEGWIKTTCKLHDIQ